MRFTILLLLACSMLTGNTMAAEKKIIYGYVEKATLVDKGLAVSAKLDTGAKSASLSAIHIKEIELNGKNYLQYTVPSKLGDVEFTSEYVGKVRIKVRSGEGSTAKHEPLKRPVVLVRIQLGDMVQTIPVNLTNRKRFIYPLLLGRDAIKAFSGLVDPATAFTLRSKQDEKNEVK